MQNLLEQPIHTLVASLEARGLPLEVVSVSQAPGEAITVVVARGEAGIVLQRFAGGLGLPELQGQLALPLAVGKGA